MQQPELFITPHYHKNSSYLFVHLLVPDKLIADGKLVKSDISAKIIEMGDRSVFPNGLFLYEFPKSGFMLTGYNLYLYFLLNYENLFEINLQLLVEIKGKAYKIEYDKILFKVNEVINQKLYHMPFALFTTVDLNGNAVVNSIIPESYLSLGLKTNFTRTGFKDVDVCAAFFNFGISKNGKRENVITYDETSEEAKLNEKKISVDEKFYVFTETYIPPIVFSRSNADGDQFNRNWNYENLSSILSLLNASNIHDPQKKIDQDPLSMPMALYFISKIGEKRQGNNASLHIFLEKQTKYREIDGDKVQVNQFTGSIPMFSGLKEPTSTFGIKLPLNRITSQEVAQDYIGSSEIFEESSDDEGLVLQKSSAAYIIINNDVLMPLHSFGEFNIRGCDLKEVSINNYRGETKKVSKSMIEAGKTALIIGHRGLGSNKIHDDTEIEILNNTETVSPDLHIYPLKNSDGNNKQKIENSGIITAEKSESSPPNWTEDSNSSLISSSTSLSTTTTNSSFHRSSHKRSVPIAENNIDAYNLALNKGGCDMIELDVILTKDNVPVINHNFVVQSNGITIPIPVLTEKDFKSIAITRTIPEKQIDKIEKTAVYSDMALSGGRIRANSYSVKKTPEDFLTAVGCDIEQIKKAEAKANHDCPPDEVASYPLLTVTKRGSAGRPSFEDVLMYTDSKLGINIELKYPSRYSSVFSMYPERYMLLTKVFEIIKKCNQKNEKRTIYFSSFDWRIVGMLRLIQNKYPVFLLHCGIGGDKYNEYDDTDSNDITVHDARLGAILAKSMNMHGMVLSKGVFDSMQGLVEDIRKNNMKVFTYGTISSDKKSSLEQVRRGVEGIIIDLVLARE